MIIVNETLHKHASLNNELIKHSLYLIIFPAYKTDPLLNEMNIISFAITYARTALRYEYHGHRSNVQLA